MLAITNDPTAIAKRQCFRRRSERSIGGLPWYDIAFGPDPETGERWGYARGVFAMGDSATGVIPIGTIARGFIAVGLVTFGVFSCGLFAVSALSSCGVIAVSLLFGMGVIGIGWFAVGSLAAGNVAYGVLAIGYVADGVCSVGHYSQGLNAFGTHVVEPSYAYGVTQLPAPDPEAVRYLANHQGLRFLRSILKYAFALNLVWIFSVVRGLWLRRRHPWVFPMQSEMNVAYAGEGGGRSYKSLWTRWHRATGVLKLLVTENQFWVWVPRHFPFTHAGVKYDLEHLIPARDITCIVHDESTFVVTFTVDGKERTLELSPSEPGPFLDAITALSA